MGDTRTDSGQFYPGGKVLPRQPGGGGGGGTVVLDDTVTETSSNGVKSSGIWTWVRSLLPSWLTASREEPPTVASVNKKYTKPTGGIPKSDLDSNVQTSLGKADTALQNHQDISGKRDLSNRQWGERTFSEWTFTAEQQVADALVGVEPEVDIDEGTTYPWEVSIYPFADGWNQGGPYEASGPYDTVVWVYVINNDGVSGRITATRTETTDHLALDSETGDALKDKADEFTEWSGVPQGCEIEFGESEGIKYWILFDGQYYESVVSEGGKLEEVVVVFPDHGVTATRTRVLRTGEALTPGLSAQGVPTDPNVAELFSESNTLFKRGVRYAHSTFAFGSGEKLKDRAINALTFTASSASHTFDLAASLPTATDGYVRDFLIRLVSDAKVTFVTDAMDIRGDGLAMEDGAADMLITLTEVASGVWYVRSIDITAQTEA